MSAPVPKNKSIGPDETALILRKHLLPSHSSDPLVMRFIASYLICRHVGQAAAEAGISKRDGENLKRRPDIAEAIRSITEKAVLKHGFDAAEVVERVKEIMDIDPVVFENPDGTFKESLKDIPPEFRRGVKRFKAKNLYGEDANGIRIVIGKLVEVEFWDKMKAVELLGREKDLFKETKKVTHDLSSNMKDVLLESKRIANESVEKFRQVEEIGEVAMIEHKSVGEVIDG